ncbi:hypothetical protein [Rhodococcus aetherivorans]|uniref:hypothetical protein n=1 Tax=Rhodococcus aetherivorans TaxID=191292 RepID=UPI001F15A6E1|nr:hypothetical protein [Rhodococcus aetherivorans]
MDVVDGWAERGELVDERPAAQPSTPATRIRGGSDVACSRAHPSGFQRRTTSPTSGGITATIR